MAESVKRFFASRHIRLSDYWLESCIQWYEEENPNANHSMETLHSAVYEQWLLLDLRDVQVPILPPNLSEQKKTLLSDIYCLQVLHVQDISQPKLVQLQRIRTPNVLVDATVNDQEPKFYTGNKRMLQLTLTDGVVQVEAIEYKPINALKPNMKPGTKIKITGPVQVRRGQIMLEERHVHLLGGEVEEILITNAYENVLARGLQLPENPNPAVVEESTISTNPEVRTNQNVQNTISRNLWNPPPTASSTVTNRNEPRLDFDDEIEMLLEAERDIEKDHATVKEMLYCTKGMEIDDDFEDAAPSKNAFQCVDLTEGDDDVLIANDSIFADIDIDSHLDTIDKQHKDDLSKVVSIAHLLENKRSEGEFRIRAKYKKVIQKLSVTDDGWTLMLSIGDESGDLTAKVDTAVLSNLIGYDHKAVMAIRKNVINKDQNVTAALMKGIEGLKTKVMKIDGEMIVTFTAQENIPVITKIV